MPSVSPQQDPDVPDVEWSLPDIDLSKLWDDAVACLNALTMINDWSISHPYITNFALLCIYVQPEIILEPLRLTGKTAFYICLVTLRLIIYPFKALGRFVLYMYVDNFERHDVERDSFVPCHNCSASVPLGAESAPPYTSYGATGNGHANPANNGRASPAGKGRAKSASNGRANPAGSSRANPAGNGHANPASNGRANPAGNTQRDSISAQFQPYGSTNVDHEREDANPVEARSKPVVAVRCLSILAAMFVSIREWGWWKTYAILWLCIIFAERAS